MENRRNTRQLAQTLLEINKCQCLHWLEISFCKISAIANAITVVERKTENVAHQLLCSFMGLMQVLEKM